MPDEAQQVTPPDEQQPARRTAMQVATGAQQTAESALNLSQAVDDSLSELSAKVTEIDQRLRDEQPDDPKGHALAALDVRMKDRETAHAELADETRRLIAELREEFGGYAGAINRKGDSHASRLAAIEKELEDHDASPGAATLAEDHIADQVEVQVQRRLDGILARLEAVERASAATEGGAGLTWDAIAERVDGQAKEALRAAIAAGHITGLPGIPGLAAPGRAPAPGVHAKVLRLMKLVGSIGKDREMAEGRQRYTYRGIDDAMDAVGHAMREVGLVYATEIVDRTVSRDQAQNREGRTLLWTSVMLTVRYTFIDPEDGSRQVFEMAGEGRASDDKATSKAAAMALKYGLLQTLMVPVSGAIPDGDAESPQITRDAQEASAPPEESQGAAPEMTDQQRASRAVDAVRAIGSLHVHPPEKRYEQLVAIRNQAAREGLLEVLVDTGGGPIAVNAYAVTALEMLKRQQAQQSDAGPPRSF